MRFLKGKLRLRQITRLTKGGHQTPIVTSRWDLRAIVLAYRMFERWRQENFFKYVREEYLIDAYHYEIEADDPNRSVPNPARKAIEKELRRMRAQLGKLRASYAEITLARRPRQLPDCCQEGQGKTPRRDCPGKAHLEKLQAKHHALPGACRGEAKGTSGVKHTERKHPQRAKRCTTERTRRTAQRGRRGTHSQAPQEHDERRRAAPYTLAHERHDRESEAPPDRTKPHAVSGNSTRNPLRGGSSPAKSGQVSRYMSGA